VFVAEELKPSVGVCGVDGGDKRSGLMGQELEEGGFDVRR